MPNNSDSCGDRRDRNRRRRGRRGRGAGVPAANGGTNTGQRDGVVTISATGRRLGRMAHQLLQAHPDAVFTLSLASVPSSTSTPTGTKRSSTDNNDGPKKTKNKKEREVPAAAPTGHSKTAATRSPGSVRTTVLRSSSTSIPKKSVEAELCENCDRLGHYVEKCEAPCGACGDKDHTVIGCEARAWTCVCSAVPEHLLIDCEQNCAECMELSDSDDSIHPVSKCPALCHYCLSRGHTMANCKKPRPAERHCVRCSADSGKATYHLPSDCVYNYCPVTDCKDRAYCTTHCIGCGWSLEALKDIMGGRNDTVHECQFTKLWGGRDKTGRMAVNLTCRKDGDHQFLCTDLALVRETCAEEIRQAYGPDGAITQWPTECLICRSFTQV